MTEKLKTLLHERAASVDFDVPDLATLTRAGDRRVRRRRGVAAVGVAALATVAVVVPLATSGGDGANDSRVADTAHSDSAVPFPQGPLTWARGETIHYGDRTIDMGRPVEAFVATQYGFVVASGGDVLQVDSSEQVVKVGEIDRRDPRLVSDESGSRAGWVQPSPDGPMFAVNDLEENSTETATGPQPADGQVDRDVTAEFYAIDGDASYWRDAQGVMAVGRTGEVGTRVLDSEPAEGFTITDVADGMIAFRLPDAGDAGNSGTFVGRTLEDAVRLPEAYGAIGALSPDGAWYSGDADEAAVFNTSTGERVTFDLPGFSTGYAWLDESTVAMLAAPDPDGAVQLLTCTVPDAECDVTITDLGTFDQLEEDFALPVGERLG